MALQQQATARVDDYWIVTPAIAAAAKRYQACGALGFRNHIREFVVAQRRACDPLASVLRRTRALLQRLQDTGALRIDGGWLEVEILEWAIEDYENAA
jgi:hypothetical protein